MPFPYLRQYKFPKGLTVPGFVKLAFKQQPLVSLSVVTFLITSVYGTYRAFERTKMGVDIKRYKLTYTVYRDDDPRVARIKE